MPPTAKRVDVDAAASARVSASASAMVEMAPPNEPERPPCANAHEPLIDNKDEFFLPTAQPADVSVDGQSLERLSAAARTAQSDSLIVIKDHRVVLNRRFGSAPGPIETRSATKGIAAVAVLALIADGKIRSLDEPLATFFPEFGSGPKRDITLRQVMNHSSGLRHAATNADALNAQSDRLAYARALPVSTAPGTTFSYSNEATQLLTGVIAIASGEATEEYVKRRLFSPLGIVNYRWKRDRSGAVQTYYGLELEAQDLARIGLLLADGGVFAGKRVLPEDLVAQLFMPSERYGGYGLCFWLDPPVMQDEARLKAFPGSKAIKAGSLDSLNGRRFDSGELYFVEVDKLLAGDTLGLRALHRAGKAPLQVLRESSLAAFAIGGLGQRLEIYPKARVVAVRQHRRRPGDNQRAQEDLVTFRKMQWLMQPVLRPCKAST
jgi:CubicO group peptidase (beta-lactamase class C family)